MQDPFHIKTERLILDAPGLEDTDAFYAIRNNPLSLQRYADVRPKETLEHCRSLVTSLIEANEKNQGYNMAIRRHGESHMIGSVGLWKLDLETRISEVGYMSCPSTWNQGIMGEALRAFLAAAKERYSPIIVEAFVRPENPNSMKLLERNNFEFHEEEVPRDPGYNFYSLQL